MLSQKTFIRFMLFKNWTPIDTGTRLFDFNRGVKYYLTFKEHESFKCLCNKKNRDKILNGGLWHSKCARKGLIYEK